MKHFQQDRTDWQIKDEILRMVEFRANNLIDVWPAHSRLDIILLRNVLRRKDRKNMKARGGGATVYRCTTSR
jgi:chemotaxis methyl-accepting protein methylase